MANKRMFTMKIVDSDAFLDMPLSTQCLYFHLNMRADDDGFIDNPKRIIRLIGASEDDFRLLIAKRFVLLFDNGIIVIKHWRMHNTLSQNRYKETSYIDEKSMLTLKDNGAYTLNNGEPIDDAKLVEMSKRQSRRTKDEQKTNADIDLDSEQVQEQVQEQVIIVSNDTICQTQSVQRIVNEWNTLSAYGIKSIAKLSNSSKRYKSLIARINEYGVDEVIKAIDNIRHSNFLQGKIKGKQQWVITFDWFVLPNNFPKVHEGQYNDDGDSKNINSDWSDWING